MSNPVFFKETPLQIQVQGSPLLVYFSCGFTKSVDPLSGMTVNLMSILQWIQDMKVRFDKEDFLDVIEALGTFQKYLNDVSSAHNSDPKDPIQVRAAQFRFWDGTSLRRVRSQTHLIFEKSSPTVLVSSTDEPKSIRIAKIQIAVHSELDLLQAQELSIPAQWEDRDTPETSFWNALQNKTSLKVLSLELWDPLLKTAQVFRDSNQ